MAFADYTNELLGVVPKLPFGMAAKAVNRSWSDIRSKRLWSFLVKEDDFVSPNPVTAGTMAVQFGSPVITPDATAIVALSNFGLFPPLTGCQIEVGNFDPLTIVSFDGTIITVDRAFPNKTATLQTYVIYKCYFASPRPGFIRWVSIKDTTNGFPMRLNWTREELDARDPQRQAQGNAYLVSAYKYDPVTGWPMFEFWPAPINPTVFNATGLYNPGDFVLPTDALPAAISEPSLMELARYYAYAWAESNKGRFPELRSTSWPMLMGIAKKSAEESLKDDIRLDEEAMIQDFIQPKDNPYFLGPIDAAYMQSHDFWGY